MKLIDFLREFKYVEPRDEAHYRELMKALQDIQNDPKAYAQVGKLNFMKRKAALDAWADKNLPKSEDGVQPTDMKRMGAMGKTLYVHKNGKTIMIPAEREKDFIQKGFKRSALRTEDQVDERMPASIIKHKEKLAHMSDKELADRFKDKDDDTLRQMAWRHGYGKMSDYYVNRKNKGMSQDTNEGAVRMDKSAFVQMLADKIKEPQKGHGRPEYDNRLLAKMYKLITGKDVDFEGDKFTITMNKPTNEDAPFDGMGLVRMALMKKFITAEEWHGLKDKWKGAVEELEQKYDDWPDGEGFGSSDHNYAIKELMELVGYKFDDQDTSGRFVVSKMPPELEKMGIKNARMKDAVTTGEDADIDAQMKVDILQFLNTKVAGIERQIEMKPAFTQEDIDNKEFTLKLIDFVQKKLDDKQKGD